MSDFGLPERQIIGRVDLQKGMFAILEQPPCKYWNRLEDCPSASPASIGIYWVLIGPLSIATMYGIFLLILRSRIKPYGRTRRKAARWPLRARHAAARCDLPRALSVAARAAAAC